MLNIFRGATVAAAIMCTATYTHADFTLRIRVTSYDAAGTQTGQVVTSGVAEGPFSTPPGVGGISLMTTTAQTPNFAITLSNNISNENVGGNQVTSHSLTANITYSGPVENPNVAGPESDKLVVEFIGIGYNTPPSGAEVFVTSNASASTGTLLANSLTFVSGVNNSNGGLPATPGDTSGLVAASITTQTGTLGPASTISSSNPAVSATFSISNPFSFYQVMTFNQFTTTGNAAQSAGSVVGVPAPAGLVLAIAALPVMGGYSWLRSRKPLANT